MPDEKEPDSIAKHTSFSGNSHRVRIIGGFRGRGCMNSCGSGLTRGFSTRPHLIEDAIGDLESLFQSPSIVLRGEGPAHSAHPSRAVRASQASGNLAHDAHIAALVVEHGAQEFWTADRDFTRFPGLRIRDPFVE